MMGKWQWKSVRDQHQKLYDFLFDLQPFNNNEWLHILDDLATMGKNIELVPQKKTEQHIHNVHSAVGRVRWGGNSLILEDGASISLGPRGDVTIGPDQVSFSGEASVMGAPVDPSTQRILPTSGVIQEVEIWVEFLIEGHGVSAAPFFREACRKVKYIVLNITVKFNLS